MRISYSRESAQVQDTRTPQGSVTNTLRTQDLIDDELSRAKEMERRGTLYIRQAEEMRKIGTTEAQEFENQLLRMSDFMRRLAFNHREKAERLAQNLGPNPQDQE